MDVAVCLSDEQLVISVKGKNNQVAYEIYDIDNIPIGVKAWVNLIERREAMKPNDGRPNT